MQNCEGMFVMLYKFNYKNATDSTNYSVIYIYASPVRDCFKRPNERYLEKWLTARKRTLPCCETILPWSDDEVRQGHSCIFVMETSGKSLCSVFILTPGVVSL